MTALTPAQAAYERAQANMRRRFGGIAPIGWDELDEEAQADWAGVASDAVDAAVAAFLAPVPGDTVIVALREPLTPEEAADHMDRWALHGPEGIDLLIVDNAAAIAAVPSDADSDRAAEARRLRAQAQVASELVRDTLEALCKRDGLSLESSVTPGEPARNYELADRLGIGSVFGLQPVAADESEGRLADA